MLEMTLQYMSACRCLPAETSDCGGPVQVPSSNLGWFQPCHKVHLRCQEWKLCCRMEVASSLHGGIKQDLCTAELYWCRGLMVTRERRWKGVFWGWWGGPEDDSPGGRQTEQKVGIWKILTPVLEQSIGSTEQWRPIGAALALSLDKGKHFLLLRSSPTQVLDAIQICQWGS